MRSTTMFSRLTRMYSIEFTKPVIWGILFAIGARDRENSFNLATLCFGGNARMLTRHPRAHVRGDAK